ncbi:unnamed protein product [Prunus armeniaca]|uniref:Uncharacterized protein n=1 Tax=Prunus armeniaca TaxID=36596 RepID=A0A6J5V4T3_PRUAR|nr:unnamed protein product [Prunus armeniaca]
MSAGYVQIGNRVMFGGKKVVLLNIIFVRYTCAAYVGHSQTFIVCHIKLQGRLGRLLACAWAAYLTASSTARIY